MLFDGFETTSLTRAAERRLDVARHQLFDSREIIGLRASQAYLQVFRNRLVLTLSEDNLEQHRQIHEDVKARAEGGEGDEADVHQARTRLELSRARVVQSRGGLRDAETDYLEAVGVMPGELELPAGSIEALPKDIDEAVARALGENPTVLAAVSTVETSQSDIQAANARFWPTVDVELTYTREEDTSGVRGPSLDAKAVVVMRYNFFRGGQDLARRQRAVEDSREAGHREGETRRLVQEQMRLDFNEFLVTSERIPILEDRVSASQQAVTTYREQFDLGRRSLLDVLDVENELFQAKVDLVDGQIGNLFSQYRVLTSMGSLLNTLNIPVDADASDKQAMNKAAN